MDRHAEFAVQLSRLVALYAHQPMDHVAEKAALRAARAAAKHGDVELAMDEGALHAGQAAAPTDQQAVAALQALFARLGVMRLAVPHQAKQDEIRLIAQLLSWASAASADTAAFATEVAAHTWNEIGVELAAVELAPVGDVASAASVLAEPVAAEVAAVPATAEVALTAAAEAPTDTASQADAESSVAVVETGADAATATETPDAAVAPLREPGRPIAEHLPPTVEALAGVKYREIFERLVTSSEPETLRRLLEPVQAAIEQAARDGNSAIVQLFQAMFACEECTADPEMRRQFLVVLRRLTKPTLLRAIAMLYGDEPPLGAAVEQVLARFGEDGAEAVADRVACAPDAQTLASYEALLGRLPGTSDALLAMLDDERPAVVARAIGLMVRLRHPDADRVLAEQLGHRSARVREAAARGLALSTGSTLAADALVRGLQDAAAEVRLAAAVGLQARREARLAQAIVPRIDDEPELEVQLALVTALGRMAASEGVQKLIALANPDQRMLRRRHMPVIRLGALEAMGEARTPAAMVALQKLLEDRDKDVREAAARLYTRARRQTSAAGVQVITDT